MRLTKDVIDTLYSPQIRVLDRPFQMNLELTTKCPLHCRQCYVRMDQVKEMPLETALFRIRDGATAGVKLVNLSGGETLMYPHLKDLIYQCKSLDLQTAIAISGAFASRQRLEELIMAGVSDIYVSLNGSTKEVDERTRDGYDLAISALNTLRDIGFKNRFINWVMHSVNSDDFPEMIRLGESLGVKGIAVMAVKPDAHSRLDSFPTKAQMTAAARIIREYKGKMILQPEPCFSQLRSMVRETDEANLNTGVVRGCNAGRNGFSVAVDGMLTPCRHLDIREKFEHIQDYWKESKFLNELRSIEDHREAPCRGCHYENNCLPCQAVGIKLHGELKFGMKECPLSFE